MFDHAIKKRKLSDDTQGSYVEWKENWNLPNIGAYRLYHDSIIYREYIYLTIPLRAVGCYLSRSRTQRDHIELN